jgi:hypothetical protein
MPTNEPLEIEVHVIERHVYKFPDAEARCSAHGQSLCIKCARNPSTCTLREDGDYSNGCGHYSTTGMHWDTCPNRIR